MLADKPLLSNCVSRVGVWCVGFEHGVEGDQQFAGDGDGGELVRLAGVAEALAGVCEWSFVRAQDGERGEIEGASHGRSAALAAAGLGAGAALAVERGEAGERCDLAAGQCSEFGHSGEQGGGDDRADTGGRAQQAFACGKGRRGGDQAGDGLLDLEYRDLELCHLRLDEPAHGRIGDGLQLMAELDGLGDGEIAQADVLGQTHRHGVMDVRGQLGMECGQAACDHGGVERVRLGQLPFGACEAPHPCGIEQIGGEPKPVEPDGQAALIPARGLESRP